MELPFTHEDKALGEAFYDKFNGLIEKILLKIKPGDRFEQDADMIKLI